MSTRNIDDLSIGTLGTCPAKVLQTCSLDTAKAKIRRKMVTACLLQTFDTSDRLKRREHGPVVRDPLSSLDKANKCEDRCNKLTPRVVGKQTS